MKEYSITDEKLYNNDDTTQTIYRLNVILINYSDHFSESRASNSENVYETTKD